LLCAPLRTPGGEIVGVVQLLNKRHRPFTKEDEEFLAEVGTHSALAVEGVRQHEAAVARARREGAQDVLKGVQTMLRPGIWPETPGFESAPLCWRSEELDVLAYAVEAGPGSLCFLLLEDQRAPAYAFSSLLRALHAGQRLLKTHAPLEIARTIHAGEPTCGVAVARWMGDRLQLASAGVEIPHVLREAKPMPLEIVEHGALRSAECGTRAGDLLVLASGGVGDLQFAAKPEPPDTTIRRLAKAAQGHPLNAAFSQIVSEWKRLGALPGRRDVFLLAARRG
ncbi:MAG: GAF domain-containing protein, partial [Thermoanaerobaculia bacterium]